MSDKETALIIKGRPISPGLAEGKAFIYRDVLRHPDVPVAIDTQNIELELDHLEDATEKISEDLLVLATKVDEEMDSKLASVFEAHQLILNDPALKKELRAEIRLNMVTASSAVKAVFLRWEKRFLLMESQVARQKGDDMRDISTRLSNALAGIKIHLLEGIPPGSVLVASRLLPSDTIFLSKNSVAAVLLEYGSAGSHAALFVREMGLPCIANIPVVLDKVPEGALVLVDADLGEVIVHPQSEQQVVFRNRVAAQREEFAVAQKKASGKAVTRDGVTIAVMANVGCSVDTEGGMINGADGIGLYRTERAYMGCVKPPDLDEMLLEMRKTLESAKDKPVCIRLLDIGSDKHLPFIGFMAETNPALGRRGIRLLREYPVLMETQLRAVLKLSEDFNVYLLIPMVTLVEDITEVKECLNRLAAEMKISRLPKLGAMIETPAAALSIGEIKGHVEFLSFGTNDLTQYAFAVDRENAAVEQYFVDSSDVIFKLLKIVHDDAPDMLLAVCGELAGRPVHVQRLLQCGIRILSVAPPLIPAVKEAVRESWCDASLMPDIG